MLTLNLDEIQKQIEGTFLSNSKNFVFEGVAPLSSAQFNQISFLSNEKFIDEARASKAGLIFCTEQHANILKNELTYNLFMCENPYAAFAKVSQFFFKPLHPFAGVSVQSCIDQSAIVHPSATIFPFVFIGPGAVIGKNTIIYSGCFIGAASTIGDDCILYPNVVVREGCTIGNRCLINPGVVIGGDGFGFAPTKKENIKIPQIGGVVIEDDVEIGANSTLDRGAMSDTKIGRQTKIDNLVMIAHNVKVGEFCFLAGQSGIAGSTTIGNYCVLAGQVGIVGHVNIGDNVTFTAQSGITKNFLSPGVFRGTPAKPQKDYLVEQAILNRIVKKVREEK